MRKPERILVIRPDRIGDVVLSTPTLRALRRSFPSAYIAALVRPATRPVLRNNPHLDALIVDDLDGADAGRRGFFRMVRTLRRHRFDTALMLLPTERHAWMTFFAGIPRRIGVGTKLYQVLTFAGSVDRKKYVEQRHEADYCLDLARHIGAKDDGLATEVRLTQEEFATAREGLDRLGYDPALPLVLINPASGRSSPNWIPGEYRDLATLLLANHHGLQVLVSVPPGDEQMREIFASMQRPRYMLLTPPSLDVLIGCIAHADVLVSASTGPMHLAGALRVPTVSLFCPLPACAPSLWRPLGNDAVTLLPPEDYCSTRCPGDPHICTLKDGIVPEDVVRAILPLLGKKTGPPTDDPATIS